MRSTIRSILALGVAFATLAGSVGVFARGRPDHGRSPRWSNGAWQGGPSRQSGDRGGPGGRGGPGSFGGVGGFGAFGGGAAPGGLPTAFSDIGGVSWALPGIEAMQTQGILQGTGPTTFDPSGYLTRDQIAAVMGRLMGWPTTATGTNLGGFQDGGSIPSWAAPYVADAVSQGVLRGFPGGRFEGLGHITWAQLAVMMARAYNYPQVSPDQINSLLQQLPYGMNTPAWAAEAVAQGVQQGLFTGVLADMFRPNQHVTRAALAQFLLRVEQAGGIPGSGSAPQNLVTGQVTNVVGQTVTVQTASGSQSITVSPTATVESAGTPSTLGAVQVGDSITAVMAGGQAILINITSGPTLPASTTTSLTGTVEGSSATQIMLLVPGAPELTLPVMPGATVSGGTGTVVGLTTGETVTVDLNSSGQVTAVTVLSGSTGGFFGNSSETGTVDYVNGTSSITFTPQGTSTASVLTLASNVSVLVNGATGSLSNVTSGETATLYLNTSGQVDEILVLSGSSNTSSETGTVDYVNGTSSITFTPQGTSTASVLTLASNVSVIVNGATGSLGNVTAGETATLYFNASGQVDEILVLSGSSNGSSETGTVDYVNGTSSITFTPQGTSTASVLTLASNVSVIANGTTGSLSNVTAGETATLYFNTSGQVDEINVLSGSSGSVTGYVVRTTTTSIAVYSASGVASYTMAPGAVVTLSGTSEANPTAIPLGDSATVALNASGQAMDVSASAPVSPAQLTTGTFEGQSSGSISLLVNGSTTEMIPTGTSPVAVNNGQIVSLSSIANGTSVSVDEDALSGSILVIVT